LPLRLGVASNARYRVLSSTVRDNILFSHEYDETFYNLVIEGLSLAPLIDR
jgi:hypothetical protein